MHCPECGLVFVPKSDRVSEEQELERYNLHENTHDNQGYLKFLQDVVKVVRRSAIKEPVILDFGCGKTAVLSSLLQKAGYNCTPYDPLYGLVLHKTSYTYDIIILCEVIEHLRDLKKELSFIRKHLNERGMVIIRTRLYPSKDQFAKWWYAGDITHINFFSRKTISLLAEMLGGKDENTEYQDIFIIKKNI